MKKFELTVPKPCHENWNVMTPDDKGRFCGSCQKSVVDFSNMSDRQIAEFFKKPTGSVCGRFHNDQLNREISIPKKRIPWVRYFFTIALPAFLASCKWGGQQTIVGKLMPLERVTTGDTVFVPPPTLMGKPIPAIKPVDSATKKTAAPPKNIPVVETHTMGLMAPPPALGEVTVFDKAPPDTATAVKETLPMDTVTVRNYETLGRVTVTSAVCTVKEKTVKSKASSPTETLSEAFDVSAYPNPVQAGSVLTVAVSSNDDETKSLQLFSSTGALINAQQAATFKGKTFSFAVPPSLAAGTYFLRLGSQKGQSKTVKIIVLN